MKKYVFVFVITAIIAFLPGCGDTQNSGTTAQTETSITEQTEATTTEMTTTETTVAEKRELHIINITEANSESIEDLLYQTYQIHNGEKRPSITFYLGYNNQMIGDTFKIYRCKMAAKNGEKEYNLSWSEVDPYQDTGMYTDAELQFIATDTALQYPSFPYRYGLLVNHTPIRINQIIYEGYDDLIFY